MHDNPNDDITKTFTDVTAYTIFAFGYPSVYNP